MPINLDSPIWGIHHIATALDLSTDSSREYTYRDDFPSPKAAFKKNLWLRDDVLAWFAQLPTRGREPLARQSAGAATAGRPLQADTARSATGPKQIKRYTARSPK